MKSIDEVNLLLSGSGGIIARHDHPELRGTFEWLLHTGRLVSVLPGVYARPEQASDQMVRVRAAARRYPNGVLLGATAARLTYRPEAPVKQVELAVPDCTRARPGFAFGRRTIAPELVLSYQGLRLTWAMLRDEPEKVVALIRRALRGCSPGVSTGVRA